GLRATEPRRARKCVRRRGAGRTPYFCNRRSRRTSEIEVPAEREVGLVVHAELAEERATRDRLQRRAVAIRAPMGREDQAELRADPDPHVVIFIDSRVERRIPGKVAPDQPVPADVLHAGLEPEGLLGVDVGVGPSRLHVGAPETVRRPAGAGRDLLARVVDALAAGLLGVLVPDM